MKLVHIWFLFEIIFGICSFFLITNCFWYFGLKKIMVVYWILSVEIFQTRFDWVILCRNFKEILIFINGKHVFFHTFWRLFDCKVLQIQRFSWCAEYFVNNYNFNNNLLQIEVTQCGWQFFIYEYNFNSWILLESVLMLLNIIKSLISYINIDTTIEFDLSWKLCAYTQMKI